MTFDGDTKKAKGAHELINNLVAYAAHLPLYAPRSTIHCGVQL